jgi:glyoxylase-like metal-dependent hydrolase (beta-lactamase superfamily II)
VSTSATGGWAEPGVEDLGRGVFRIPLPLPNDALRAVNVYAISSDDGLLMVDAGWALDTSEALLASSLRSIGYRVEDVRRFLVTHCHRDHYTQAVAIRRRFGARVSLGAGEEPNLTEIATAVREQRHSGSIATTLRRAGAAKLAIHIDEIRASMEADDQINWEMPDQWLLDDEAVEAGPRTLRVIETPGHTRGHVVFHDAQAALLFAGDHVLPHITPSIGFEPSPVRWPLRDYLDSLRLVQSMPDAKLLPAHGPVAPSVHDRVAELLEHHDGRLSEAEKAVVAGAATAYDVAMALRWTRREHQLVDLDPMNQMLAISETAAHLDVLVLQNRLAVRTLDEGIDVYEASPA